MNTNYIIEDNSIDNLKKLGFKHIGDGIYHYNFCGYKWNGYQTITCRFIAFDDSNSISIDVFQENGNFYAPFYSDDNNNEVLSIIYKNIDKERTRCGIRSK